VVIHELHRPQSARYILSAPETIRRNGTP